MAGWLSAFRDLGLVEWTSERLLLLREPTDEEVDAARRTRAVPFRPQFVGVGTTTSTLA
jgi:hypothetical protein